jgi:hypothetical protein
MITRRNAHRSLAFIVGVLAAVLTLPTIAPAAAMIGNALGHDLLRDPFAIKEFRLALQPAISMEEFNAGPRNRAARVDRP